MNWEMLKILARNSSKNELDFTCFSEKSSNLIIRKIEY